MSDHQHHWGYILKYIENIIEFTQNIVHAKKCVRQFKINFTLLPHYKPVASMVAYVVVWKEITTHEARVKIGYSSKKA